MRKTKLPIRKPEFQNEDEEARWWACAAGRAFLKRQPVTSKAEKRSGSPLVWKLNRTSSVQICIALTRARYRTSA